MNDLLRILRLGRSGRRGTWLAILLGTLASGAAVALAGVSAWLIARAAQRPPVLHLMVAIVAVRAFGIGRGVLRYGERLAGHDAAFRVLGDLRSAVVGRLAVVLPGGPSRLSSGDLSARFVREVDGLVDLWVRVLVPAVATFVVSACAVTVSVVLAPTAGLVLAGTVIAGGVVVPVATSRLARRAQLRVVPDRAEYRRRVLELLDGAAALAVDGRLDDELVAIERLDDDVRRSEARTAAAAGIGGAASVLATGVAVVGGLLAGASAVRSGELGGPGLAVVVLLPFAVHEALGSLTAVAAAVSGLRIAARRVCEVLDTADPVHEPARPTLVPAGPVGLRLDDVTVAGPDGNALLHDVTVEFPAGSVTTLVGPSGLGKSTLAALLMRFVAPTTGEVVLESGGRHLSYDEVAGDEVRRHVGWCAQDAHVFDSTVRANLMLARPEANDEQLWQALCSARLDGSVRAMPHGLDSLVGEHGRSLSGGERQRLALARVLLADRPIVVFDEPTEHVDDDTARELLRDLVAASSHRTTIVITHRLDLVGEIPELRNRVVDVTQWRAGATASDELPSAVVPGVAPHDLTGR